MTDTNQLLLEYAQTGSESAFRTLVARYLDLVYSVALRRTGGDAHMAQDIAQSVFTDLARKARTLPPEVRLGGWLHRHTCFVASTVLRTERRRRERERQAAEMNSLQAFPDRTWDELGPVLDEAIDQLDATDREAIVLRFFERRDLQEVGVVLGISEDAAQKRVSRAVDRLRERVNASGVATTATALGAALVTSAVNAAPAGMAATISSAALVAAGVSMGIAAGLQRLLFSAKGQAGLAALVVAGFVALVALSRTNFGGEPKEGAAQSDLPSEHADATNLKPPPNDTQVTSSLTPSESNSVLRLKIVAADSGQPVPFAEVQVSHEPKLWGTTGLLSDRDGLCDVAYQCNVGQLVVWIHLDGFADTRLLWRPTRGEVIPTNYVLRLDRPTPIGGRVLDDEENPIPDVRVGWYLSDDPGGAEKLPESHEFPWIITKTDAQGRWRIDRIAEDMYRRLVGYAKHTNYLDAQYVHVSWRPLVERELREGTHVFKLGRAVTAMGMALDSAGVPIGDAKVLIGRVNYGDSREGTTAADGTFSIPGCVPGLQWVSAEARGYAATTVAADLGPSEPPIRLVLERGKTLRLRVTNRAGAPIPKATVYLDPPRDTPNQAGQAMRVLTSFQVESDHEGRVVWTNAPVGELRFGFLAPGYVEVENITIPADGEEHPVTLASAVVVQGTVRDQATGELLPRFRIGLGYPELSGATTHVEWARFDRFWVDFTNGIFRYSCDEPLQRRLDGENPGYVLKFEATGYASHVSRIIGPDEGLVQLDVELRPAASTTVTVFKPDGQPAALADVGFYYPGSRLQLAFGGLSREASPGGAHAQTDKNGTFELRPDDSIDRVLVVCLDGYVEITPAALVANPVLHLQPWGRLEVTGLTDCSVEFGNGLLLPTHSARLEERQPASAPQIKMFPKLPPGHHTLIRKSPEQQISFEIRAGETTTLDLSASTNAAPTVSTPR